MPNNVIQKVYNGGNEYLVAGGASGEGHEFITQADYDNLTPAQKAEKVYMITGEGSTPTPMPGSVDSFNRFITNQPLATYSDTDTLLESNMPTGANFFVVYSPNRGNNKTVEYPIIIPINFIKQSTTSDGAGIIGDDGHNTKVNSITYSNNTFTFSLGYGNAYLF